MLGATERAPSARSADAVDSRRTSNTGTVGFEVERRGRIIDMPATGRVIQGAGARGELARELRRLGAQRPLIVTGRSIGASAEFDELLRGLEGLTVAVHREVMPHNPLESLMRLIEVARATDPDALVSVGGGTPVDAAKLTSLALAAEVRTAEEMLT
jgi:alcohol dehydrogenase class IV